LEELRVGGTAMEVGAHQKILAEHLDRRAYLYVRQSSLRQVIENTESTQRQYALRDRAISLGWKEDQVVTIDCDLGQSGATAENRDGFQRLVADVSLGRAGIVMGLEVSRLARRSSDWHRLLEICALTRTLLLDEDGLYDPSQFNDKTLLGLKGNFSETELHYIRMRLQGGLQNKASRGELKVRLPVGFVYDPRDRVVLTPQKDVQESIRLLFKTYDRLGNPNAVMMYFKKHGLKFPQLLHSGPSKREILWRQPKRSRVVEVLRNPRYAGAFAWGRRRQQGATKNGNPVLVKLPREKWHAFLPGVHDGYISLEEYDRNLRRLAENSGQKRFRYPAREGPALLQGIAICARCGSRMTVGYHYRRGKLNPDYICQGPQPNRGEPVCQSMQGDGIDKFVGKLLVDLMKPVGLEVALAVQAELEKRLEEADKLRYRAVERAQYEVDLARRRYMQVDPDNRMVADQLEADWNGRLRGLREARDEYERARSEDHLAMDEEKKARIRSLASDFPALWQNPNTPSRERKRMVRLLIEDVTLGKSNEIAMNVRFKGGAVRTFLIPKFRCEKRTPPDVVAMIDRLLDDHTEGEVAEILNENGMVSGCGRPFNGLRVRVTRRKFKLRSRCDRLRAAGYLKLEEAAKKLGRCKWVVRKRRARGRLPVKTRKLNDRGEYMYKDPDWKDR
jgi:DNA invertase Pin-like site-specific DNA recombinase